MPHTAEKREMRGARLWSRLHRLRWQAACAAVLAIVFAAVYWTAFAIRFEGEIPGESLATYGATVGVLLALKIGIFGWFRIYRGWSRYVTFQDMIVLVQAATVSSTLLLLVDYLFLPSVVIPRSVFLLDWLGTVAAVGGMRSLVRIAQENHRRIFLAGSEKRVLIVGADNAGEILLRALRQHPSQHYRVVGFVTRDPRILGARIGGAPVLGRLEETCSLARQYAIDEILVAAGRLAGRQIRTLVESARASGVCVKVVPCIEDLLTGQVDIQPRSVSIEDLLNRDPVELDLAAVRHWIDGRTLMVTGSAGSIGSEICRQLLQFHPRKLILVDRSENGQFFLQRELGPRAQHVDLEVVIADINDAPRMQTLFAQHQVEVVFHAAAYKHVPLMEENPGEAVKNIALATQNLAQLASRHGVGSFVMISTDKAVNPTSVMGACKRAAELYVQALAAECGCRFVTVRFGNVLDSAGSVAPIFRQQIAAGGPVTVTHAEMVRYFMTIPEASQLVIQAGTMGRGGEIFVLDMGEPVRILDLARDMIRLSGLEPDEDIEIAITGLRPGEKLYEELHAPGERRRATSHSKILIADCRQSSLPRVETALRRLANLSEGPREMILGELADLIPEYAPSGAGDPSAARAPATPRRAA